MYASFASAEAPAVADGTEGTFYGTATNYAMATEGFHVGGEFGFQQGGGPFSGIADDIVESPGVGGF